MLTVVSRKAQGQPAKLVYVLVHVKPATLKLVSVPPYLLVVPIAPFVILVGNTLKIKPDRKDRLSGSKERGRSLEDSGRFSCLSRIIL